MSVRKRQLKKGTVYTADFKDQRGVRHRRDFALRKDAVAYEQESRTKVLNRSFSGQEDKLTVEEVAAAWYLDLDAQVRRKEISEDTADNYKTVCDVYLLARRPMNSSRHPHLRGKKFPDAIAKMKIGRANSEETVRDLYNAVLDIGLARATARHVRVNLSCLLDFARMKKMISANAARGLRIKGRGAEVERATFPEREHLAAFMKEVRPVHRFLVEVAISTGLRSGELRSLKWGDVDTERRLITVQRGLTRRRKIKETKTKKGKRLIPISNALAAGFRARLASLQEGGEPQHLVFPSRVGTVQEHSNMTDQVFYPAWKRAIAAWNGPGELERCTWHQLRHFAVSAWIAHDVGLKEVSTWAGHSSIKITLDLYGHLFRDKDYTGTLDRVAAWLPTDPR